MQMLSENIDFLHNMANALLEEETIDHKQIENLYKYGSVHAPEEESKDETKSALEAAGIIVPDSIPAEPSATKDEPKA